MLFMLTYEKLLHHYDHRILNYLIMLPDNDYIIINDKFNNNIKNVILVIFIFVFVVVKSL